MNVTCATILGLMVNVCSVQTATARSPDDEVKVGSKTFTENIILGEITSLLLNSSAVPAKHVRELGGTRILWNAILSGEIDAYPDYTGTLAHEILAEQKLKTFEDLRAALDRHGLAVTGPLGFNNTYAIGMTKLKAKELGIRSISDLVRFPRLRFGFSNEFMDRAEGWPGLRNHYHLPQQGTVKGMNHDLAYRAIESGSLDAMDLYSTDAEIAHYDLVSLVDDQKFFPTYDAVIIYRKDLAEDFPQVDATLAKLSGRIDEGAMIAMNASAKIKRISEGKVASDFINQEFGLKTTAAPRTYLTRLKRNTIDHGKMVLLSLTAAILVSIPLGIAAAKLPRFGYVIMTIVSTVQTIPSLALLVFMIPLVGIGAAPAILALFLYSLLPIVRNTHQGLVGISPALRDAAVVLGLPARTRLYRVELPLAAGAILAGIKTAAVINIGTATLGALVGAGGYGQPILTGIRLDNINLILLGAVPAAIMALAAQWAFEAAEKLWLPQGLRLR